MNFPKREELLFLSVWALPKASSIGFALRICCERAENCLVSEREWGVSDVATAARYWITFFVFSVLPAPDSPLCMHVRRTSMCCRLGHHENLRHENTLVFALFNQITECLIGDCEDMRSGFLPAPALVHPHVFVRIDGQRTIWIHCDQKEPRIRLMTVSVNVSYTSNLDFHIHKLNPTGNVFEGYGRRRAHSDG